MSQSASQPTSQASFTCWHPVAACSKQWLRKSMSPLLITPPSTVVKECLIASICVNSCENPALMQASKLDESPVLSSTYILWKCACESWCDQQNRRALGTRWLRGRRSCLDTEEALNLVQKHCHGSSSLSCQNVSMEPAFPTCEIKTVVLCCHRLPYGKEKWTPYLF